MAATETLVWVAYGVVNVCVGLLVAGVRPLRLPNGLLLLSFASNAAFSFLIALSGGDPHAIDQPLTLAANLVERLSKPALIALPFVFPRRRLSPGGERVLLGVVGAYLVADGLNLILPSKVAALTVIEFSVFYLGITAGVLYSLETYLAGPSEPQRVQARFVLAAYALKMTNLAWPWGATGPPTSVPTLTRILFAVVLLAVVVSLAASRGWLPGKWSGPRPLRDDAFVLGAASLGIALPVLGAGDFPEYLLLRPLLLGYGMVHHHFADVDVRGGALLGVIALSAVGIAYGTGVRILVAAGVDPFAASGFGLAAALALGVAAASPLLRRLGVAPRGAVAGDRVYRAALEAAAAAGDPLQSRERILRALRSELAISERQAALAEEEVRASVGPGDAAPPGERVFLGRYRVESRLGEGGTARAYLATDAAIGRRVVLKVARASSPEKMRAVAREARVLARLNHPAIVTVFDVEEVAGEAILVLEHLPGGTLEERLRRGPLPLAEAVAMADRVLLALEAAHAEGIVHRDVKPGNVLFNERGEAKLADFGVASVPPSSGTVSGLTTAGTTPGTLRYMAPEQVRGQPTDARTDLYAVGAVLVEALTGEPYLHVRGRAGFDTVQAILDERPRLPIPGMPAGLNALLEDLLAKDPAGRPASAREARKRLLDATRPYAREARKRLLDATRP